MKKQSGSAYQSDRQFVDAHHLPRVGFTLVELLVVIAIIGMLMALLLPAVNSAREQGRRSVCLNNMKQLSTALRSYESTKKELPGYANIGANSRVITWPMTLFPNIERNDVWSVWSDPSFTGAVETKKLQASTPYMEIMVCPSNPPADQNSPWLAFVANCGKQDPITPATIPPSADGTTAEKLANGVFFNRYTNITPGNKNTYSRLVMSLDHIPDGASNTFMLSENIQAYKYTDNNNLTGMTHFGGTKPAQYEASNIRQIELSTGFVWDPSLTTNVNSSAVFNGTLTSINAYASPVNLSCGTGAPPTTSRSSRSTTPPHRGRPPRGPRTEPRKSRSSPRLGRPRHGASR
jgi:prepilin-type N-terminal cleavage/methylation domain-containing protein